MNLHSPRFPQFSNYFSLQTIIAVVCSISLGLLIVHPALAQSEPLDTQQGTSAATLVNDGFGNHDLKVFEFPEGPHFIAGEAVIVDNELEGDVYAVGATIRIDGLINGDLLVAGGNIVIAGEVTDDVRIAGGNVTITGTVGKNVTVAGGNVTFTKSSTIGKSLIAAGGTLNIDGTVTDNALATGGNVIIGGNVGQDIRVESGSFVVSPTASVSGNLVVNYQSESQISPEAIIGGTQNLQQVDREMTKTKFANDDEKVSSKGSAAGGLLVKLMLGFFMGLASGGILFYLLSKPILDIVAVAENSLISSIGWGLVYLIIAPILAVILITTIIGLPLGLITLFSWIIDLIVASWVAAFVLGRRIAQQFRWGALSSNYAQFALGLFLLQIVYLLPLVSGITKLIAILVGMGAIIIWFKNLLQKQRVK